MSGRPGGPTKNRPSPTNHGPAHRRTSKLIEFLQDTAASGVEEYACLVALFELGWDLGYHEGYAASEADMAAAWHQVFLQVRLLAAQPTRAELDERRRVDCDPCTAARCDGCSRCVRQAAVLVNLRRFGVPDFPGTDAIGRVVA